MREKTRLKRESEKKIDVERLRQKRLLWKEANNRILKYGIAVAHDKCFKSPAKVRLTILYKLEEELKQRKAIWQLKILRVHIGTWIKTHFDTVALSEEVKEELKQSKQRHTKILSH